MNLRARDALEILFVGREESSREIEYALAGNLAYRRLHWVAQPDLAPSRAAQIAPDVILLDDELGRTDVISLIRQLLLMAPNAAVLVLVSMQTMSIASRAVMAGARGFVARPLSPSDLVSTILMVLAQDHETPTTGVQQRREGHIVAVVAPKGGTGRTTLAVNAAVALQEVARQKVVVVDADYVAPAVDVMLNLQPRYTIVDLLARVPGLDEEYVDGVLIDHASGVRSLLAPEPGQEFDVPGVPEVQEILVHLKRMFGWVLVDLGLPLDEMGYAYLDAADRVVLNVLPEMVGLRNTRALLDAMVARGYGEQKLWLVVNRSPTQGGISKADIEKRLRLPVVYQFPDDPALVIHCVNRGVPVVMSYPKSALARAVRSFAQGLHQDLRRDGQAASDAAAERGWLSRLLGRTQARASGEAEPALAGLGALDAVGAPGDDGAALEMSDSLIVEACPYLGLENDPDARFPYPCTANVCRSEGRPAPVDPPYQGRTCFGRWTACPRFVARLESGAGDEAGPGARPEAQAVTIERDDDTSEAVAATRSEGPEPVGEVPEDLTQSGGFVLQSCPYLGLATDESVRYPYPDVANRCHARGTPAPVTPALQAETCFSGNWAPCPHFQAGLTDSVGHEGNETTAPNAEEEVSVDADPFREARYHPAAPDPRDDAPEGADGHAAAPVSAARPEALTGETGASQEADAPQEADAVAELFEGLSESCPYLGLAAEPDRWHPFPDAANHCHAEGSPIPLQPAFQAGHCLGEDWTECERWKARAHRDEAEETPAEEPAAGVAGDPRPVEREGREEALPGDAEPDAPHAPSGDVAAPAAAVTGADPWEGLSPDAPLPEPGDAELQEQDTAAPEPAGPVAPVRAGTPRCPHLGLDDDPTAYDARATDRHRCYALGEGAPVSIAYQEWACLDEGWEDCPRRTMAPTAASAEGGPLADADAPAAAPSDGSSAADDGGEEVAAERTCPFLGLREDPHSSHSHPNKENYCHAGATPFSVMLPYQARVCLVGDWNGCLRFQQTLQATADEEPPEEPVGRSLSLPRWAIAGIAVGAVALIAVLVLTLGSVLG